jgi:sugar O-acyltransferase (sialic acid O-acetyltransferase NeuD family)
MATAAGFRASLVIVGAGGHGIEVASYCEARDDVRLLGFIDEGRPRGARGAHQVLGGLEALKQTCADARGQTVHYITAVGDNATRKALVAKLAALALANLKPFTLVHGAATPGVRVALGDGTCLAPGAIATTAVRIGMHCIVNVGASVSHDCLVGDYCNLNPGSVLCGNVTLGEGCYIGAGAVIKERITIGPWTTVGAGAVVVRDLPANVIAKGVPARASAPQA